MCPIVLSELFYIIEIMEKCRHEFLTQEETARPNGNEQQAVSRPKSHVARRCKDMKEQTERIITSKEGEGKCHFTCRW
jgi:hypothetical protein